MFKDTYEPHTFLLQIFITYLVHTSVTYI